MRFTDLRLLGGCSAGASLPHLAPTAAAHAATIVEFGAMLLATTDAALLCVEIEADGGGASAAIRLWDRKLVPSETRLAPGRGDALRPFADAVERAGESLWLALAPRWPDYARPAQLGFLSDGTGLGFCPDDPWPLAPGWLDRQLRAQHRLTPLVPFDPLGAWSLLVAADSKSSVQ